VKDIDSMRSLAVHISGIQWELDSVRAR